jgi:hypothetical protein
LALICLLAASCPAAIAILYVILFMSKVYRDNDMLVKNFVMLRTFQNILFAIAAKLHYHGRIANENMGVQMAFFHSENRRGIWHLYAFYVGGGYWTQRRGFRGFRISKEIPRSWWECESMRRYDANKAASAVA